jgi:hypothetical protein
LGFHISDLGFEVLNFGYGVWGFEIGVLGFRFQVAGVESDHESGGNAEEVEPLTAAECNAPLRRRGGPQ